MDASLLKLRELETTFLNTQVLSPFCTSWSKDDYLYVRAEGGVFVYELWPTPLSDQATVTFRKAWISADSCMPLSNAVVSNINGSFLWSLERKAAYETCMDPTLSYAVHYPNPLCDINEIVQCEFSPLICGKSYIACLTNHGLLQVYKSEYYKWFPTLNLTELWTSICNFYDDEVDFDTFKKNMYTLKIISIKWIEVPEVMFLTGHENGELVLWKIDVENEKVTMSVKNSFQVEVKPICLSLHSVPDTEVSLWFLGALSGVLKCLVINLNDGTCMEYFTLWSNEDLIAPNFIHVQNFGSKICVFTVKRHIVLIQTLTLDESKKLQLLDTQFEEFDNTITSWNEYQNSFIITLLNHDIYVVTLKFEDEKIHIDTKFIENEMKKKHKTIYSCFGLAMSREKALWILVSSPKQQYNTLKDITQINIFTPEIKVFKSLSDTTSCGLIEQIMTTYPSTKLSDIFDFLVVKKLEILADSTEPAQIYKFSEDFSLLQLQLLLWDVRLRHYPNVEDSDSVASRLEVLIAKKRANKVISDLRNLELLSVSERQSLDVCEMFVLRVKEKDGILDEVCRICGCDSICVNIRTSSCSNHHNFPRCCLSLLPCNVVPYAICKLCNSVALKEFVTGNDNRCTYCDGLLEIDTRFRPALNLEQGM